MPASSEFSNRDLVAGALVGIRTFRVLADGRLGGVVYAQPWTADVNEAECRRVTGSASRPQPHPVASLNCTCGFYAYFDLAHNHHHKTGGVLGLVRAWGLATVGDRGFRCERARIVALIDTGGVERSWTQLFADQLGDVAEQFAQLAAALTGKPAPVRPVKPPITIYASHVPEQVRTTYPDVPVFRSVKAAVRAFPLTPVETPTRGAA